MPPSPSAVLSSPPRPRPPRPPPPPALKLARKWEGVGVWPDGTPCLWASQAQNPTEWAVVAEAAVLSTVAGLHVGEMGGIKVRGLDGIGGTITFWDGKVAGHTPEESDRGRCQFLHWWAIRKMGRSPHDTVINGPRQLEIVMAKLLAGSKW